MAQTGGEQAAAIDVPDYVFINHVRADRAEDFEQWLRSVVVPAVRTHRPHTVGRWRVLRAREADEDTVVFAFLFYGGSDEDWDLESLVTEALGPEKARQQLEELEAMYQREQYGWTFVPVDGMDER